MTSVGGVKVHLQRVAVGWLQSLILGAKGWALNTGRHRPSSFLQGM